MTAASFDYDAWRDDPAAMERDDWAGALADMVNHAIDGELWFVAESIGSDGGPWQITAWDFPDDPASADAIATGVPIDGWRDEAERRYGDTSWGDATAWLHVLHRAAAGSTIHQMALHAVLIGNPMEYLAILDHGASFQLPATT